MYITHTGEFRKPRGGCSADAADDDADDVSRLRLSCCNSTIMALSRRCCSSALRVEDLRAASMPTISPSSSVEPADAAVHAAPWSGPSDDVRVTARRQSL